MNNTTELVAKGATAVEEIHANISMLENLFVLTNQAIVWYCTKITSVAAEILEPVKTWLMA